MGERQLTHGSLFAGIGGFDLGFERAGFKTIWQVEVNEYCRSVLRRHFPDARLIADVRDVYRFADEYRTCDCCGEEPWCERHGMHFGECECIGCSQWDDEIGFANVITGGFPCQDISLIGKRAGIDGERSGLWSEMRRIVRHLQPDGVVVENVSALLGSGIGRVLGDLAEIGYDAEWDCLPAHAFGAPHRRDRVFIVGYRRSAGLEGHAGNGNPGRRQEAIRSACAAGIRGGEARREIGRQHWEVESQVGRVAHGIPAKLLRHQLECLGNAVVPQIAEWIAQRIKQALVQGT